MNSTDLFLTLYKNITFKNLTWWPNYGTFEVIVGAILTQQTTWKNVEICLINLKKENLLNLQSIAKMDLENLQNFIKQSGFFKQKSIRLKNICEKILEEFGDFETFKNSASREFLLSLKGIGPETCDSILCYACNRELMVVDNYTLKILKFLGYEFESYFEAQEWLMSVDFNEIFKILDCNLNEFFCAYHGLIVEFCKTHLKKNKLDEKAIEILQNL